MVGWFFLFILVCALLVALYTVVLPKFFIKYRYRIGTPADRGLKIARGENGQSIVYEPACTLRPYIRKYILSEKDGKKSLICKIDEGVGYLDYDVVLFDQKSRAFKGIRVKEFVERAGYTREVDLPSKTCYVSLLINEADGILFDHHAVRKISKSLLLALQPCASSRKHWAFWLYGLAWHILSAGCLRRVFSCPISIPMNSNCSVRSSSSAILSLRSSP